MDVELPKGPLENLMGLALWVIDTIGAYMKRNANLNSFVRYGGMEGVEVLTQISRVLVEVNVYLCS